MIRKLLPCLPRRTTHGMLLDELKQIRKDLQQLMSTTGSGLSALQAADASLAAAVSAAISDIAALAAQIATLTPEDSQVAVIAADIQAKADALNAAVAPPAAPAV